MSLVWVVRRVAACSMVVLTGISFAFGQQEQPKLMDPRAHPKFEVATITLADPEDKSAGFHTIGERLFIENERMETVFAVAFDIQNEQIVNAPEWFRTQHFDIKGKADLAGIPGFPQQREMLRNLLEERLGLKVHHETREMQRFTIQVARGGPKLTPAKAQEVDMPDQTGDSRDGVGEWRLTNNSAEDLAEFLRDFLKKPVLNQTDLKGKFDFTLRWAREDAPAGADTKGLPGLLTALREQLGLKVETSKGPTDVIVIDHVDRPSDN